MIETTILSYLKSVPDLSGIPIYIGTKPSNTVTEYIVIEVLNTDRVNYIDAVTFNIESYSTSLQNAAELNEKVKTAMYNATSLNKVASAKLGGGGQNINANTKSYCYECVFNIFYYS